MYDLKLATMLFTWNGVGDRFLKNYFEPKNITKIIDEIKGTNIRGVELQHPNHVNEENIEGLKELLKANNIQPVIINIPMAGDIKWKKGSFTSNSEEVRLQAVERVKKSIDIARNLGTNKVSMFLGQDGFDYPLTSHYNKVWDRLLGCFEQIADYAPDVKICVEYKPYEPRTHQFLSTASKTLLLAEELDKKNIGLLVDIGHAWIAGENMGETICLAARKERLFHIHFNDNFRKADDDLGVGAMHFTEILEALFWIREVGYDGWVSMDVHSPREDSVGIITQSIEYLRRMNNLIEKIGQSKVMNVIEQNDGTELLRFINETIFGK